jgi:pimeloyl-ACP methyl ester carboxylesterase
MAQLTVNSAELYYEVRGAGPPVLLIMGFTGDSGHVETLAELLADEFTVVSYDRRGNGRSPRPAGWATTSAEEQADDAAALLNSLGLAPAAVCGTSAGGNFALCLLVRHPDVVRGAVLHEPALVRLFDDPGARGALTELVRQGMQAGGPAEAQERLFRWVAGDANWERLQPDLRGRMRATADTFFEVELGRYEGFLPDDAALAAIAAPVMVLVGTQTHAVYVQAARRLAQRLGVEVTSTPGTHTAYHDHPHELAETVRPFLRQLSGIAAWSQLHPLVVPQDSQTKQEPAGRMRTPQVEQ